MCLVWSYDVRILVLPPPKDVSSLLPSSVPAKPASRKRKAPSQPALQPSQEAPSCIMEHDTELPGWSNNIQSQSGRSSRRQKLATEALPPPNLYSTPPPPYAAAQYQQSRSMLSVVCQGFWAVFAFCVVCAILAVTSQTNNNVRRVRQALDAHTALDARLLGLPPPFARATWSDVLGVAQARKRETAPQADYALHFPSRRSRRQRARFRACTVVCLRRASRVCGLPNALGRAVPCVLRHGLIRWRALLRRSLTITWTKCLARRCRASTASRLRAFRSLRRRTRSRTSHARLRAASRATST